MGKYTRSFFRRKERLVYLPEPDQRRGAHNIAKAVRLAASAAAERGTSDTPLALTKPAKPAVARGKATSRKDSIPAVLRAMRGSSLSDDK